MPIKNFKAISIFLTDLGLPIDIYRYRRTPPPRQPFPLGDASAAAERTSEGQEFAL